MTALLREGDVVSVNGVVLSAPFDFDGTSKVKIRVEPYHDIFVIASDVTVVRPDFRVGDRVTWSTHDGADSWAGHILSIANDHLWVQLDDGSFSTVWASKASRVDPKAVDPDPVEPPPAPLDGKVGTEEEA